MERNRQIHDRNESHCKILNISIRTEIRAKSQASKISKGVAEGQIKENINNKE